MKLSKEKVCRENFSFFFSSQIILLIKIVYEKCKQSVVKLTKKNGLVR